MVQSIAVIIALAAGIGLPYYFQAKDKRRENEIAGKSESKFQFKIFYLGDTMGHAWGEWIRSSSFEDVTESISEDLFILKLQDALDSLNININAVNLYQVLMYPRYADFKIFPPTFLEDMMLVRYGEKYSDIYNLALYVSSLRSWSSFTKSELTDSFHIDPEAYWKDCIRILSALFPKLMNISLPNPPTSDRPEDEYEKYADYLYAIALKYFRFKDREF